MFDWEPITDRDYLELWIFETVKEYQEQLRVLVLEHLGRNVILEEIDVSRGFRTIPFAEYINVVERNLRHLVGTDVPEYMTKTIDWHGGLLDDRRLDYTDVNRWFEIIRLLYELILTFQKRYLMTGTFYTGVNPDLQLLGLG